MKWYFKITRGYTAWYVGKGAYCFASVGKNPVIEFFDFLRYMFLVWRHKPVKVLKYRTKMQPPADVESVRAAAVSLGEPVPQMVAAHFGTQQDDAAAVEILNGSRPGVEYFECPECGHNTLYHVGTSPGWRESIERYECENPDCLHTTSFP